MGFLKVTLKILILSIQLINCIQLTNSMPLFIKCSKFPNYPTKKNNNNIAGCSNT